MIKGTRVLFGSEAAKYTSAIEALRRCLHR